VEVNDGVHTATTDVIINIVTVTTATLHILENQVHLFDLKGFLQERGFNLSDTATFIFLSGNELMNFAISLTGTLSTQGLDREGTPEYHLNINVTDPSTEEAANVLVNIDVEDVNDHSPVFLSGEYVYFINETTYVSSTFLGQVVATDLDDPTTRNARLQYSLLTPNRDGFSITTDGVLYVRGTFDREDRDQYVFVVRAEDFGEPDQKYGYVSVVVNVVDINDNNPQFSPPDVVEFFVEVELVSEQLGPGVVLDKIIAVLPVVNKTVELDRLTFHDPDISSTLDVHLNVVQGADKYKLERLMVEKEGEMSYVLVTTDYIQPEDDGTILRLALSDEIKEENPVIRNVTILVTEITEPAETPTSDKSPPTGGVTPTRRTDFFRTEIGIAVIVVLALLGMATVLLCCCLVIYAVLKYRRSKDPLNARDRFISVAQRIQETRGRKGRGKPWEYYDYSDMDTLEFPEMTPEERDANFMYGADTEHESTFMSEDPYNADMGTPEPLLSTATSFLSSLPNIPPSYQEPEEDEEEEDVRTYTMGPVLKAMLEEFERGDSVLKKEKKKSRSKQNHV
jgi:hypothetical protein